MAILANWQHDFTDNAGNLLSGPVTVEVRIEGGALGVPYDGRDTATAASLGNPFVNDGGAVVFYIAGGAYKIKATHASGNRELRYVAIGRAAEADIDDFATAAQGALADTAVQAGGGISNLVVIDETGYAALDPPDATTAYLIVADA